MRIFKNAWFVRFARAQNISDEALREAVLHIESGQVDADLGGGVVKQRIARLGQGKSKGYRTIILLREGHRAFFVYGFSKSDRDNIRKDEEERALNNGSFQINRGFPQFFRISHFDSGR